MELNEKTIQENTVFEGKIICVRNDDVLLQNGKTAKREVAYHHGGVCVVPLTKDGNVILVRQFRYPYKEVIYEIPAGKLEKGENPYDAGLRELEEETGYRAKELHSLGKFYPTPGYCSEIISLYFADNLEKTDQNLDEDEFLDVCIFPFKKALEMVMNDEIRDGKTQTALLKIAFLRGIKL